MAIRRTKILATLGPATDDPKRLDAMVAAGMDGGRINCAHDTPDAWRRRAAELRGAATRAGRPLSLLLDLAGPKMRLGTGVRPRQVTPGESVIFASGEDAPSGAVPVDWPGFAGAVSVGRSEIVIGDGTPGFRVVASDPSEGLVTGVCQRPGAVAPRKGIFCTYVASPDPGPGRAGPRRPGGRRARWTPTSSRSRSCAPARTCGGYAARMRRPRLPRPGDREDREGRGVRVARRDHRRLRRPHGRARRPGRGGGRRARPADPEGGDPPRRRPGEAGDHRHPDARVDDRAARADARRGDRRRERDPRRHVGRDALGRDHRRPLPGGGGRGDGVDRHRGRARLPGVGGRPVPHLQPARGGDAGGRAPGPAGRCRRPGRLDGRAAAPSARPPSTAPGCA